MTTNYTKTKLDTITGSGGYRYFIPGSGWQGSLSQLNGKLTYNTSTITQQKPSAHPNTNLVEHIKLDISRFGGGTTQGILRYTNYTAQSGCNNLWGFQYQTNSALASHYIPSPVDPSIRNELKRQLNANLSGKMQPAMQALVSLVELGEIKDLPKQIKALTTKFGKTIGALLKQGAQADLVYKFALAPIVADAKAIINVIDGVQQRLNDLALKSGKPNTFRARLTASEAESLVGSKETGNYYAYKTYRKKQSTYSSGLDATVDYFISDGFASTLLAQRLMIDNVIGSAWELAKLSFVLDWFVNIGGMLASLNNKILSAIGADIGDYYRIGLITDSWMSTKTIETTRVIARMPANLCSNQGGWASFGEVKRSYYSRGYALPSTLINYDEFPELWGPGFSPSRAITGGELIVVKLIK